MILSRDSSAHHVRMAACPNGFRSNFFSSEHSIKSRQVDFADGAGEYPWGPASVGILYLTQADIRTCSAALRRNDLVGAFKDDRLRGLFIPLCTCCLLIRLLKRAEEKRRNNRCPQLMRCVCTTPMHTPSPNKTHPEDASLSSENPSPPHYQSPFVVSRWMKHQRSRKM